MWIVTVTSLRRGAKLIARKLNEFMVSLIAEPQPPRHRPIGDLIKLGES